MQTFEQKLHEFKKYLYEEEKSGLTIEKYVRDVRKFNEFINNRKITKELVLDCKNNLIKEGYAPRSINSMLASVNKLLKFLNLTDCCVKSIKIQNQIYSREEKELTKNEYLRLLETAKNQPRLRLIIETICSTGIRVSELSYFTVENVRKGEVIVTSKGKVRIILLPGKLKKKLLYYAMRTGIHDGRIFRTKNGKAMNRTNIWSEMKGLRERARVKAEKVFPHNLRKLFARTFYKTEKDIAKLADILGHSSINTTSGLYFIEVVTL